MNCVCLIEVLRCAGFKQVRIVAQFTLPNRCVPSLKVPHLVAHADVQDGSRDGMDFAKGPLGLLDKFESIRMRGY
jgi:hypothetical protein